VKATRIQCDEVWAFCYSKQKNVATAKAAPEGAGDVWTWTALEAGSKLLVSPLSKVSLLNSASILRLPRSGEEMKNAGSFFIAIA
jgi:hypothetical protein